MSQLCALSSAYSSGSTRWRLLGGPRCRRHPKQARRTLPLTCQDGNIHFFCKEFIVTITFSAPGLSLPGTHDKFRLNANRRIPSAGVMSPVLRLQTKTALMLSDKSEWAQGSWEHLLLLLKETWIGNTQTAHCSCPFLTEKCLHTYLKLGLAVGLPYEAYFHVTEGDS